MTNPNILPPQPQLNPREIFVQELKHGLLDTQVNAGNLGQAIGLIVTEVAPSLLANHVVAENLNSTHGERALPIQYRKPENDYTMEVNVGFKNYRTPVSLRISEETPGVQTTRLELGLREICSGFGRNGFKLSELPVSIFTLTSAAQQIKEVGEKAAEIGRSSEWEIHMDDPTTGPYLMRHTRHGQTDKTFAQVLEKATNGKLKVRKEKTMERTKRVTLGQFE